MSEQLLQAREEVDRRSEDRPRQLIRLIHSLDSFTEEELFEELKQRAADYELVLDLQRSLKDYLKDLVAVGVLRYQHGSYSVR
jgi:hypothetical protein